MGLSRRTFTISLVASGAVMSVPVTVAASAIRHQPRPEPLGCSLPCFSDLQREFEQHPLRKTIRQWRWTGGTLTLHNDHLDLDTVTTGRLSFAWHRDLHTGAIEDALRAACPVQVYEEFKSELVFANPQ